MSVDTPPSHPKMSTLASTWDRISHLPSNAVIRISQILIAIHVVARFFVFGSGFFYIDDYIFMGRAARFGLLSEDLLMYLHKGHLMPGGMFISGVAERMSPLNYWPVLLLLVAGQFLATWLTYRLLRLLMGTRPALLIPMLILTLTPMTLLPGSWWAAAVNFLPLQIAAAGGGIAIIRGLRGGSRWWFVLVAAWQLMGLAFFEKSVLLPVTYLAIAAAAGPHANTVWQHVADTVRKTWLVWLLVVPIVLFYLVYYLDRVGDQARDLSDTAGIVVLASTTLTRGLIPSLFGGPITWNAIGFGTASANPSAWLVVVTIVIFIGVMTYGLWQSARSRSVWLLVIAYVLADLVILIIGRSGFAIIPELGLSLRYTVDTLVIILVALAITVAPPQGQTDALRARQTRRRLVELLAKKPVIGVAPSLIGIVLIVSAAASHVLLVSPLTANDSRIWLTSVRQSIADTGSPVQILDGPVPDFVLDGLNLPYNQFAWTLAPLSAEIRVEPSIATGVIFDDDGQLVPAQVQGIESLPGPNGDCGWGVKEQAVNIALANDVIPWQYATQISYLAAADMSVTLQLGQGDPITVDLLEGPGVIFATIDGGGPTVTVTPTQTDFGVCIAQVRVGVLTPSP
jgi:hypothetical protein